MRYRDENHIGLLTARRFRKEQMEEDRDDRDWRSARYDPNIQLGMPRAARVEFGETVLEYYKRKHATVGPGRFYGCITFRQRSLGDNSRERDSNGNL